MDVLVYLSANPVTFLFVILILGLLIGSFLNVVIHRLPLMMQRDWHDAVNDFLKEHEKPPELPETYNLILPNSSCPHCNHQIKAWENIPVLSYLFLRGRCSACQTHISARYPIIEAATAALSFIVAWKFGLSAPLLPALIFTWALIALTMIDYDHKLLPDDLTLPLIWAGLLFNLSGIFAPIEEAIIGAVAGYLSLWTIYWIFKLLRNKEGMGYGDFKLLSALGAWLGWKTLPVIVLCSSFVGAVVGITLILFGRDKDKPIPFGPYLAAAGFITLIWGDTIISRYINLNF